MGWPLGYVPIQHIAGYAGWWRGVQEGQCWRQSERHLPVSGLNSSRLPWLSVSKTPPRQRLGQARIQFYLQLWTGGLPGVSWASTGADRIASPANKAKKSELCKEIALPSRIIAILG
jgi:hypothetical protein